MASTIDWLQRSFGSYYKVNPPRMPDRFTRREFGFILWPDKPGPPPFVRHRAYDNASRFHNYLAWRGPHSCYYSTAYYRRPGEMRMLDKQWLGAELIFDLDADHLAEAEAAAARGETMGLPEQLELVKKKFRTLLEEFLLGDLGIDEKDVWLTFSGGRGYHAHVTAPALLQLDQKGRREVVDYVTGKVPTKQGSNEPDLDPFIWEKTVGMRGSGMYAKPVKAEFIHPSTAPGWRGRLTRGLVSVLRERVLESDPADARAWLLSMDHIGPKGADDFIANFTPEKLDRIQKGYLEQGGVVKRIAKEVLGQAALPLSKGETDEPVTADVKRLIRLPESLHGKTGLKVVRLNLDELKDFDPFRDAVAFSDAPVKFTARNSDTLTLGGETVTVAGGQDTEVPMHHAIWWCSRQNGTVRPN